MEANSLIHIRGSRVEVTQFTVIRGKATFGPTIDLEIEFPALPTTADEVLETAQLLASCIASQFSESSVCHLILPGTWCLTANVELLANQRSNQAALFTFEQLVPADLEKLTCTLSNAKGQSVSVASVLNAPIKQLISELENSGYEVASINIDTHLLSHAFSKSGNTHTRSAAFLLLVDRTHVSIIYLLNNPDQFFAPKTVILPSTCTDQDMRELLCPILATLPQINNDILLVPLDDSPELHTNITKLLVSAGYKTKELSQSLVQQWLRDGVFEHRGEDFRHGVLANKKRWATVSSIAKRCAACLALFLIVQGIQIRSIRQVYAVNASHLRAESQQVYSGLFPGSIVPPSVAMRLRSERIKLEGMTKSDQIPSSNERSSGLHILDIFGSIAETLPSDIKIFVNKLVIDDAMLTISGQTTDHAAAGIIAQALHKMPGIQIDPPSTKMRSDKTVEFRIRASLQNKDS